MSLVVLTSASTTFAQDNSRLKLAVSGVAGFAAGKTLVRYTSQQLHENADISAKKSVAATALLAAVATAAIDYVAEGELNPANIAIALVGEAIGAIWTLHDNPIKEVRDAEAKKSKLPEFELSRHVRN